MLMYFSMLIGMMVMPLVNRKIDKNKKKKRRIRKTNKIWSIHR